MKCPVCGFEISDTALKCPDCSFNNLGFEFINLTEYDNWMLQTVIPHRDRFIEDLLDSANSYLELGKELMNEAEDAAKTGEKIPEEKHRMRLMAIDMVDKICNKITEMSTDWIMKSILSIKYVEHMGFFDCYDDHTYIFDFSKPNLQINYKRTTPKYSEYVESENECIKSSDVLRKAFLESRILDLVHSESEELYCDGAWWEIYIYLKYPVIEADFSEKTYWAHYENTNDGCFTLWCSGQFNKAHDVLMSAIRNPIALISKKPKTRIDCDDYFFDLDSV